MKGKHVNNTIRRSDVLEMIDRLKEEITREPKSAKNCIDKLRKEVSEMKSPTPLDLACQFWSEQIDNIQTMMEKAPGVQKVKQESGKSIKMIPLSTVKAILDECR